MPGISVYVQAEAWPLPNVVSVAFEIVYLHLDYRGCISWLIAAKSSWSAWIHAF